MPLSKKSKEKLGSLNYSPGAAAVYSPIAYSTNIAQHSKVNHSDLKLEEISDLKHVMEKTRTSKRSFKNIVEKQKYWDSLVNTYGQGVKHRQIYTDFYETPFKVLGDYSQVPGSDLYVKTKQKGDGPSEIMSTSWKELLEKRDDIQNKPLFFASLMDEGADQFTEKALSGYINRYRSSPYKGFSYFGLDRIYEEADRLEKKGYLPEGFKEKMSPVRLVNEKNESVISADFQNLNDVITAKNAIIRDNRERVKRIAEELQVNLSNKAVDYFTIVGYNAGMGNAKKIMKKFKREESLINDRFLYEEISSYKQVHRNAIRRLQTADMLRGEGYID